MHYQILAELYQQLEATPKRLNKTCFLAHFLKRVPDADLPDILLLVQGLVFPSWDERELGMSSKLMMKALGHITGMSPDAIEQNWKKTGDLGLTAEQLVATKKQTTLFSKPLTTAVVMTNLRKLPAQEGSGSVDLKLKLIAELFASATPLEAKYLVRTILGDLRVGAGESVLRDALIWAYLPEQAVVLVQCHDHWTPREKNCLICSKPLEKSKENEVMRQEYNALVTRVQEALDISNDFGEVAKALRHDGVKGLHHLALTIGKPMKSMLFQKAKNIQDGFAIVGKPAALEYKYDGFRINIHRHGHVIRLFTRRLEEVTQQFPDLVEEIKKKIRADNYILDGEVIGVDPKTGRFVPFQEISQRIRRKYDIAATAKRIPVMLHLFDAIVVDNDVMIQLPFQERRKRLQAMIKEDDVIHLANQIITDDEQEAERFYKESLAKGNEGIMMKNLEGIYKPGSRVGYGIKVKPVMETLDLVIVGAEWGEGKRAGWLTSFILACKGNDGFLEIGRVGTGIKEGATEGVSFEQLTELLNPFITSEKGKEITVKPKIVIEVNYEEIQKSQSYGSGYALRFPRLVRLREDRRADESSTLEQVEELYRGQ
ncbi:ATP-dependent DNA ligase [Candidatus Woesearchaeota archaeon]|nr:ATP-dependent DNA ligase [Candidatus Woesearchaeota archaeon]